MASNVTLSVSNTIITASTTTDTVNVSTTTSNIVVGTTPVVENSVIRGALSATDPVSYNSSTGVISVNNTTLLSGQSTSNLTEGTNLYFTTARSNTAFDARIATSDTGDLPEGTNLYFTEARARNAVSVTDSGGDGSLAYNNSTGVITYAGPSAAEVRAHVSVTDTGGDGSLAYNSSTGVFTFTGPSASEVRAHISNTSPILYNSTTGVVSIDSAAVFSGKDTDDLSEGSTNLYYTTARNNSAIAAYTGAITNMTGNVVTTANIRTTSSVVAGALHSNTVTPPSGVFTVSGEGVVSGNLVVGGNIDYTHVNDLFVANTEIVLNANSNINLDSKLVIHRPQSGSNAFIQWNEGASEAASKWEFYYNGNTFVLPKSTDDLAQGSTNKYVNGSTTSDLSEGTNLYFTTARLQNLTTDVSFVNGASGGKLRLNSGQDANATMTNISDDFGTTTGSTTTSILNLGKGVGGHLANNSQAINNYRKLVGRDETEYALQFQNNTSLKNTSIINHAENIYLNVNNATQRTHYVSFNRDLDAGSDTLDTGFFALEVCKSNSNTDRGFIKYSYADNAWFFGNSGGATGTGTRIPVTTADLTEGTNLYYTNARVDAYINASIDTDDVSEGSSNQYFTTARSNTAFDARLATSNTNSLAEGSTNLYYTTARANSAILAYQGNISTGGEITAVELHGGGSNITGVVKEALDTGKLLVGSSSNTAIGVTPQTNFVTTGNAISLSNNLTSINTIKGEENANVVLSGQAVNKLQVATTAQFGTGNYFTNALGGGTQGVIFNTGSDAIALADGTQVFITGFEDSGGNNASNLNGTYFIKSFGSGFERIKLLWADANLSVATDSGIVGGSQTLSPAGFLDIGTSHGNLNINSSTDAVFDTTLTVDKKVSIGGDASDSGNLQIKEFQTSRSGTNFNFIRGRGTEASQTELNQGDEIMAFRSEGTQNRYDASTKQLKVSTIQRIEVDNPNTFKTVPSTFAMGGQRLNTKTFDGGVTGFEPTDFTNFGFRLGSTEIDDSKTYLQDSIVATPGEAFAPKGLTVGNETALQEGLEDAELQIGHTDTDVTIPVRFNNAYQANSGIQLFSASGHTFNFLTRGTGDLNGDQVCVELWSNLKPGSDYEFQGYQEGWIADGSKLTVPATSVTVNNATGALANISNSTISGATSNEFYVKGVSSYKLGKIYALFTDSAMANALTWSTLGGGTPNVNGESFGGFGNVTYKTGDYSMLMQSSNVDTSASGANANFIVSKTGSTYKVGAAFGKGAATQFGNAFGINMLAGGDGFAVGETVTISGEHLGGVSGTNNLTFTVDSVSAGAITSIGNVSGTGNDISTDKWSIKKGVASTELEITNNNVGTATRRVNLTSNVILNLASHTTTQINAFTGNVAGDVAYNSTLNQVVFHNGSEWRKITDSTM